MYSKLGLYFWLSIFLWSVSSIETYDDFCDEPHRTIYCTCDVKYRETIMACYITGDMNKDDEVWDKMSNVENVYTLKLLTRNPSKFEEIPIDSLKTMPYLENLKIQQANLSELQSYAITELKFLRELDLEDCGITGLQDQSISNMPKLKKLSLGDNLLQELLAESLTGLLDLESLFLERNSISRIEGYAFSDLQNLRELELWQNEITDLTEYMFRGLRYLKRLDMSRNKISILNDKIFHSMPKLEDLDLHGNLIHHVAPRAFQGLEKLQVLSLRMNRIKVLPHKIFKSLPNLRTVNVYENALETIHVQVLEHMDKRKDPHFSVDFNKNPLVCDCRLSWVKTYLQYNSSRLFTSLLQQLQCKTKGDNVTLQPVYLLQMDCVKPAGHGKTTTPEPRAIVLDLIPHEIHKLKNKTMLIEEVTDDDAILVQDSETEVSEKTGAGGSAKATSADFNVVVFMTLLTVFLVRKRKGTC